MRKILAAAFAEKAFLRKADTVVEENMNVEKTFQPTIEDHSVDETPEINTIGEITMSGEVHNPNHQEHNHIAQVEEKVEETYGGIGGELPGFEEPDVINFDTPQSNAPKEQTEKKGLVQRFKDLPTWGKITLVIVIASAFMLYKDYLRSKQPAPSAEVELTPEMNTTQAPQVETKAVAEKTPEQVKAEKLNSCLIATPLAFKFGQAGVIPMFGSQDVSNEAAFCDEFTLKNYHLDGSNNSLSIVGDVYSGEALVKHVSVDPLSYFKPTYYLEGISIKHPVTQAEVQYMPGDFLLKSPSATLQLTGVSDKGTTVEYQLLFNGQKTAISVDRKYVQ